MAKVKLKVTNRRIMILVTLVALLTLLYLLNIYWPKPVTSWDYNGNLLTFRSDLREAAKVKAYPDEATISNVFASIAVRNITIVYAENISDVGYVTVEAAELSYKLTLAYLEAGYQRYNMSTDFIPVGYIAISAGAVKSYENLKGTAANPIIALVPPSMSDETSVSTTDHVIYVKGKTQKDFDLATIKLLMIVLDIKV
jgi:hypothetical protein